jgi:hypothetical protein
LPNSPLNNKDIEAILFILGSDSLKLKDFPSHLQVQQ